MMELLRACYPRYTYVCGVVKLIAWNSKMALDARHHLYYQGAKPQRVWRVENAEGKDFVLKLYEVSDGTDAVKPGHYMESVHVDASEEYDADSPESGTEWAYVETSIEGFLNHYKNVEEIELDENID